MNLPQLKITEILRRYTLTPSKSLGQNFLVEESYLARVAAAGEITAEDEVLEIGAGLGSLTRHLALSAKRVVAVELDAKLIPPLKEVIAPYKNIEVVQGDILKINLADLFSKPGYLVVANIPYYLTSALIRYLLEAPNKPARLVITVQQEVAQRICAGQGNLSLLAISVQVYGKPVVVESIPAGAFYPPPKIDSAIVKVNLFDEPRVPATRLDIFFRLVKAGFSQKRKTLRNALSGGLHWEKEKAETVLLQAGIDPQRRAQTLSIDEWIKLIGIVGEI